MPPRTSKLPIASVGPAPVVLVDAAQWHLVERAYGTELADHVRLELTDATNDFLRAAQAEQAAETRDRARKRVSAVLASVIGLYDALDEADQSTANAYAVASIDARFKEVLGLKRDSTEFMEWLGAEWQDGEAPAATNAFAGLGIRDFISGARLACLQASNDLSINDPNDRKDGDAWNAWVRKLTDILRRHDMPVAVRKDVDIHSRSPFVKLVMALEGTFSSEFRRGGASYSFCLNRVDTARRGVKPRKAGTYKPRKSSN